MSGACPSASARATSAAPQLLRLRVELQKTEGTVTFHTAMSTAFPQPAPGAAPSPGPLKIPEDQARRLLGVREVNYVRTTGSLAVVDTPLG